MSRLTISADHGGVYTEVTVATEGNADDYALVLDRALRAVTAALTRGETAPTLFDQEATQPLSAEEYAKRLEEAPY